jgi:hypothetical protein
LKKLEENGWSGKEVPSHHNMYPTIMDDRNGLMTAIHSGIYMADNDLAWTAYKLSKTKWWQMLILSLKMTPGDVS